MPWNTLNKAYNHKDVLQRPLESAQHATPPQVEYALTPLGRQFVKPLQQLVTLVNTNADVMVYERD